MSNFISDVGYNATNYRMLSTLLTSLAEEHL